MGGFVLKSHYTPTAERASIVNRVVPGARALGAITLNAAVGGMNAMAVEIAALEGARIVWFPTFDALNEPIGRSDPRPGEIVPIWADIQRDLRKRGFKTPPVLVVDPEVNVLPEVRDVLRVIAEHDLVLAKASNTSAATRSSRSSMRRWGSASNASSSRTPSSPRRTSTRWTTSMRSPSAAAAPRRCFTTPYTGKTTWELMFGEHHARAASRQSFVATDLE